MIEENYTGGSETDMNAPLVYTAHIDPACIYSLSFSAKKPLLAVGGNAGTVIVWDVTTRTVVCTYSEHRTSQRMRWHATCDRRSVNAVAFHPDGQRVASGGWDDCVHVWNALTGQHLHVIENHRGQISTLAWSPDGRFLASGSDDTTVRVTEVAEKGIVEVCTYRGHHHFINDLAWSPDGKKIISVGRQGIGEAAIQIWDASSGEHLLSYTEHSSEVCAVDWSPDGRSIASGSSDGQVHVWDAVTGQKALTYTEHERLVKAVHWSPDGWLLASGGNGVHIWEAASGRTVLENQAHDVNLIFVVRWSPDGRLYSAGSDGVVRAVLPPRTYMAAERQVDCSRRRL